MQRVLQAELLDSLPPDHPAALHNRRDLRLTNRILGHYRWFARTLSALPVPPGPILELGAGLGELGHHLAAHGFATDGLDLWPRPADWPAARAWHRADLLTFDAYAAYRTILGNLIFHQFTAEQLAALGATLQRSARIILACEPVRCRRSQIAFATCGRLLGANHVSLHDAHVSIAAGFVGDELPQFLGLRAPEWTWQCQSTTLGSYRMVAWRT